MWIKAIVCILLAGQAAQAADILTLDDAIKIASDKNRDVRNARLDIDKATAEAAVLRSRMLPNLSVNVLGSQLLSPIDFTFQQGLLGVFPEIGPVPAKTIQVQTPMVPTFL